MKSEIVFLMAIAVAIADPSKYYDSVIDVADTEKMVTVKENLRKYADCFLDKGPCDEVGGRIRKVIPESVKNACARCTQSQKHTARRFFEELTVVFPDDLAAFSQKYDPEFKYFYKFMAAIKDT